MRISEKQQPSLLGSQNGSSPRRIPFPDFWNGQMCYSLWVLVGVVRESSGTCVVYLVRGGPVEGGLQAI